MAAIGLCRVPFATSTIVSCDMERAMGDLAGNLPPNITFAVPPPTTEMMAFSLVWQSS